MSTPWKLALMAVVGLALLVVARGCAGGGDRMPETRDPVAASTRADDGADTAPGPADAELQRIALVRARDTAMQTAVDTLHRYLGAIGGADPAIADAYWADGRRPAASDEAGLRALQDLRALRIANRTPVALDAESVPAALEIPVELRASFADASQRRYAGRYRLRRAIDGARWEITSADVDVLPPRR